MALVHNVELSDDLLVNGGLRVDVNHLYVKNIG